VRGVGDTIMGEEGWGASVVTSSVRDWVSRVRKAGMIVQQEDLVVRRDNGKIRGEGEGGE
jgi:hypothetical protein